MRMLSLVALLGLSAVEAPIITPGPSFIGSDGELTYLVSPVHLFVSADHGRTLRTSVLPAGVADGFTLQRIIRAGTGLYAFGRDAAGRTNIYRAAATPDGLQLTWKSELVLAQGAQGFPTNLAADSQYVYAAEYGLPEVPGGPSVYRRPINATGKWTRMKGPDPSVRHIHAIAPDPYRPGEVWLTQGDGIPKSVLRSTNSGRTWTVAAASPQWQSVQISFTPDAIWFAPDVVQRVSAIAMRRADLMPVVASATLHRDLPVPGQPDAVWHGNAFWGAADPASGAYYFVSNDNSTWPAGKLKYGLFKVPRIGAPVEYVDTLPGNGYGLIIQSGRLYFGQYSRKL
jgi:hypothetical protein